MRNQIPHPMLAAAPELIPARPLLALARTADDGFDPSPPCGVLRLMDVADPDHEEAQPNPLVSPSYRESLLPVAEHAGAV